MLMERRRQVKKFIFIKTKEVKKLKRKIFSVLFALAFVTGLILIPATPVSAAAVGRPTLTLSTSLAGATDVVHTISFDIGTSLSASDTITVTFAGAYATPTTWADGDVTVDGTSILGASVSTATDVVTIVLPSAISTGDNPVAVVFTAAANVPNPVAASYTLSVATTAETAASTESYTILNLATVTGIEPVKFIFAHRRSIQADKNYGNKPCTQIKNHLPGQKQLIFKE